MNQRQKSKQKVIHTDRQGNVSQLPIYKQAITNIQVIPFLIESLSPDLELSKEWLVELDDEYRQTNQGSLIGGTVIGLGGAKMGKFGLMYWKFEKEREKDKDDNMKLIVIDCNFYKSTYSFVKQLVQQISIHLDKQTSKSKQKRQQQKIQDSQILVKRMVVENNINLKYLDSHILSRPHIKFLFAIRNCQKLIQSKRQTVLYNLLEWIKGDVKEQIGLYFTSRMFDFLEGLEKRVKSRLESKIVYSAGPKDQAVIKKAILSRFSYALENCQDTLNFAAKKFVVLFEKSTQFEKLIKQQRKGPRTINFYLQITRMFLALTFNDHKFPLPKDQKQFDRLLSAGFQQSLYHFVPYICRQKHLLLNMNYQEYISLVLIRKLMLINSSKISLKQIFQEQIQFKKFAYTGSGTSFVFTEKNLERALKNLKRSRIIDIFNEKDFQNAEIAVWIDPHTIKQIIEERQDLPEYVKKMLN